MSFQTYMNYFLCSTEPKTKINKNKNIHTYSCTNGGFIWNNSSHWPVSGCHDAAPTTVTAADVIMTHAQVMSQFMSNHRRERLQSAVTKLWWYSWKTKETEIRDCFLANYTHLNIFEASMWEHRQLKQLNEINISIKIWSHFNIFNPVKSDMK